MESNNIEIKMPEITEEPLKIDEHNRHLEVEIWMDLQLRALYDKTHKYTDLPTGHELCIFIRDSGGQCEKVGDLEIMRIVTQVGIEIIVERNYQTFRHRVSYKTKITDGVTELIKGSLIFYHIMERRQCQNMFIETALAGYLSVAEAKDIAKIFEVNRLYDMKIYY